MGMAGLKLVRAYNFNLIKCFFCLGISMLWLSITFAEILTPIMGSQVFNPGGDHGQFCSQWIENLVGAPGLTAILLLTAIIFLTYLSKETITVVRKILNPVNSISNKVKFDITNNQGKVNKSKPIETLEDPTVFDDPQTQRVEFGDNGEAVIKQEEQAEETKVETAKEIKQAPSTNDLKIIIPEKENLADSKDVSGSSNINTPINPKEPWTKYKYPTLDLLKKYENDGKPYIDMKEQTANKNRIVEVLNNFGVQIKTITLRLVLQSHCMK